MDEAVSFRVAKDDLANAVAWVARSLPSKVTQPVLRAMLITADDNGLEFTGFDYEVSTRVRIAGMVDEPGQIAVAGKLLSDIVASLPNKEVEISQVDSKALVTCGSSRFELPLIPLDDYPQLPVLPEVTGTIQPQLSSRPSTRSPPRPARMTPCPCSPVCTWISVARTLR